MAVFTPDNMPKFNEGDLAGTVRKLYSFTRELQDQLAFVLMSLDGDNVEGYEEIFNRLQDSEGNISTLKQTASGLTSRVESAEGKVSTFEQTVEGFNATVLDYSKAYASMQLTVEGFNTTVASYTDGYAEMQQTVKGFNATVVEYNKGYASMQQTVNGFNTTVADYTKSYTEMQQTANALATRVSSAEGSIATVQQTADGLSSTVTDLSGKYSKLQQTVDGFNFTGVVYFDDLTDGSTSISGNCIDTGWVSLDHLDISNDYGYIDIQRGSTGSLGDAGESTRGVVLAGPTVGRLNGEKISNSFFVSDAGVRITAWDDDYNNNNFWVSGTRTHMDVDYDTTSDRRKKNSIAHDVAERYGVLYRALRPARFKFNNGTSDRFHTGFIAQEVEQAIADSGLDNRDLAALIKDEDGMYALRYAELIALNTAMIQKLMEENDNLKAEIAALKEGKVNGI